MSMLGNSKTIYVVCPAYFKTGGTELLHQLVYELNNLGKNAIITYQRKGGVKGNGEYTDPDFKKYIKQYIFVEDIKDVKGNLIIVPEMNVDVIKNIRYARKVIWWLSVDNYMIQRSVCYLNKILPFGIEWIAAVKKIIRNRISHKAELTDIVLPDYHLYQSYYAKYFLEKNNIYNKAYLSDYINDIFLEQSIDYCGKQNIVLYNPRKGMEFTKKIIKKSPMFRWVPIQGLSTNEVRELLTKSKVYIDFGNHPGKDRFPREAAISGCCIITGKKGAANYKEDIPIPDEFKFNDEERKIDAIIQKIENCINQYEMEINKFEEYRCYIMEEKKRFKEDVRTIFCAENGEILHGV